MNWIDGDIIPDGPTVQLQPLKEDHFEELVNLGNDKAIWQHIPVAMNTQFDRLQALISGMVEKGKGTQFPFAILHKASGRLIGSTRFMDMHQQHLKLEIGWTWLHPDHWGTRANPECKLLLLSHCFEVLKTRRVHLKTDEHNIRSRKAIAKIGASFEGILRYDMIRANGTKRNSAYFSITDDEWPIAKQKLQELIGLL